jgi:hypothetical protein
MFNLKTIDYEKMQKVLLVAHASCSIANDDVV